MANQNIKKMRPSFSDHVMGTIYVHCLYQKNISAKQIPDHTQPIFTCSMSTMETPEQCKKSIQIW